MTVGHKDKTKMTKWQNDYECLWQLTNYVYMTNYKWQDTKLHSALLGQIKDKRQYDNKMKFKSNHYSVLTCKTGGGFY